MRGKSSLIHLLNNQWIFSYTTKVDGDSRIVRVPLLFDPSLRDGMEIEVTLERNPNEDIYFAKLKKSTDS